MELWSGSVKHVNSPRVAWQRGRSRQKVAKPPLTISPRFWRCRRRPGGKYWNNWYPEGKRDAINFESAWCSRWPQHDQECFLHKEGRLGRLPVYWAATLGLDGIHYHHYNHVTEYRRGGAGGRLTWQYSKQMAGHLDDSAVTSRWQTPMLSHLPVSSLKIWQGTIDLCDMQAGGLWSSPGITQPLYLYRCRLMGDTESTSV